MPKCRFHSGPVFWDTDRQAAQGSKPILKPFNTVKWELNKVYFYQE